MDIDSLRHELGKIGQEHVLRFYDSLDKAGRARLIGQLQGLDLAAIAELADQYVRRRPRVGLPREIEPVEVLPRVPEGARVDLYHRADACGEELLRRGKIGAFLVAGGQGTRLGYDGPKGQYPVTPIRRKPLFQVFAEELAAHGRDSGRPIAWYIMTSDVNDGPTRSFFEAQGYFGLDRADVFIFPQGMMPAFGADGRMLLAEKDSLALSPDGHGGALRALHASGALADMGRRGIEHLSYFQVDNPLVYCIDPRFLGLHALLKSEMSSKTVAKVDPLEKVGNFVMGDGVLQVIEYSDLPEELALAKDPRGERRFNAGSIAIHALRVDFLQKLNSSGGLRLPWHRAEKKVPYVDEGGTVINPSSPNAVKLEQFVFDAIPLASGAMVYETDRAEEFSPVKNAEGADSPASCRRDQIRRASRWLSEAGAAVPMKDGEPDAVLEISPLLANSPAQLRRKLPSPPAIARGQSLYME